MSAEKRPVDEWLFLPKGTVWTSKTACAVLKVVPNADDDDVPEFVKDHELQYAMHISQVQDIVINARLQRKDSTPDMLVQAFLFYYDRDAFIDFDAELHHE